MVGTILNRLGSRRILIGSILVAALRLGTGDLGAIPNNGENDSLILTCEMLNMLLGDGLPVVASLTKPRPFIYSWKVL